MKWGRCHFLVSAQESNQRKRHRGSDASAAGGRGSEQSEWQRSIADEGFLKPRKISGTATGRALAFVPLFFNIISPDVAQFGRALALGARCRRFESCHSDHNSTGILIPCVSKWACSFFLQKP